MFFVLGILYETGAICEASAPVVIPLAVYFVTPWLTLYLFVPRLTPRPYRKFQLVLFDPDSGAENVRIRGKARVQIAFFVWWRQVIAAMLAGALSVPVNFFLTLPGLQITGALVLFAGLLAVGPLLVKMLTGQPFQGFRIEARRGVAGISALALESPAG